MALKFTKLTRNNLRNLKAGQSLCEHGIIFERLSNGDGRYVVNVMIDGKRVHRVIGKESDGVTRLQAEELIEKLKTDARHGRLNLPKGRKVSLDFETAADEYIKKLESSGGKDMRSKRYQLKLHLKPFFKGTPLAKITTLEVDRFKKMRKEQDVSLGTINRELSVLSHLLNRAVEWGWIDHRSCQIKKFKEDNTKIVYLTTEQINRLLDAAKQDACKVIYLFIFIALETSMRKMEILSIEIKNIHFDKCTIYVPKAKAGARTQPMTKKLAKFLKVYVENLDKNQIWLFPSETSESGHMISIEKPFRRVVENAGLDVKTVNRHTLRHTVVSHLVQAGVDLPTVQKISGHKSLQMVLRYSHQNNEHIQSAMDVLEKRYASKDND